MSYSEYRDLFLKAQKNKTAPFKMFVFDLKNGKKMSDQERAHQQLAMFETMNLLTEMLLKFEKTIEKKVLLRDEKISLNTNLFKEENFKHKPFSYKNNPCVLRGDSYNFYIYNNSIAEKQFLQFFLNACKATKNIYTYNFSSGNFETTVYKESEKKYYIGHCVEELSENKKNIKKEVCLLAAEQEF